MNAETRIATRLAEIAMSENCTESKCCAPIPAQVHSVGVGGRRMACVECARNVWRGIIRNGQAPQARFLANTQSTVARAQEYLARLA